MSAELSIDVEVDVQGLSCPLPILRAKKALSEMQSGQVLQVLATDSGAWDDFDYFCKNAGHALVSREETDGVYRFVIRCR
jgi:tRNA 2-thiouridine synthesizing protein A